jgi:FkbM family methyltransferase
MSESEQLAIKLDPDGFNEIRMCRSGPIIYNKHDIYVGGSLQKYGEFSEGEQELFRRIVHPASVVVEVGANIGAHTVELSRLVGVDGEVYAFEPQRIVFQALCANLALNQCANVFAKQAALGAENGVILVPALNPAVRSNFGGVSLMNISGGEPVDLLTLDELDLPACHVLKVDVEGMEVEVLSGAQRTLDQYRPIMYLENDRDERSQELLGVTMDLGYTVYWHLPRLYNPANFYGIAEDIFPNIVSVNILCIPNEANPDIPGLRRVTSPRDSWRV